MAVTAGLALGARYVVGHTLAPYGSRYSSPSAHSMLAGSPPWNRFAPAIA
jgi:hypothetical protein